MKFYVRAAPGEEPTGPWSRNELLDHTRSGRYGSRTLARAEREEKWQPLSEVIPMVPAATSRVGSGATARSPLTPVGRSRFLQVARHENEYSRCELFRTSGLGYMILGGVVVIAGLLGVLASDDSFWGVLCLLSGVVAGAVLVGLGTVVRVVAEMVGAVQESRKPHAPNRSISAGRRSPMDD